MMPHVNKAIVGNGSEGCCVGGGGDYVGAQNGINGTNPILLEAKSGKSGGSPLGETK